MKPAQYATEADPTRDDYTAGCLGCQALALAAIGAHVESQRLGTVTPRFRETLEAVFGEGWREQAVAVRDWGQRCMSARKAKRP